MTRRPSALARFVTLAAFAILAPCAASAASVNVSPTKLTLGQGDIATNLALRNEATTPVRFSVRAFTWRQLPDGAVQLDPTDDLIVFPQIVTIGASAGRDIRIAYTGPRLPGERAYRIIASELPGDGDPQNGIALRTRFSIPLFLAPTRATQSIALTNVSANAHAVAFDLNDDGTAHALITSLRARAFDSRGATLFDTGLPAWYVLPGEPRRYAIPTTACARIASLSIDGTVEDGPPLRTTVVPDRTC